MEEKADPDIKTEEDKQRDADVEKCLDTEQQEPLEYESSEDVMPSWLISVVQYLILFFFGVILVVSICSLIFYFADEMAFVIDGLFVDNLDYICFGLCVLTFIGSFVGLYALSLYISTFIKC